MKKQAKNKKQSSGGELTTLKKGIFFIVMLLIPVALFLLLEGILILFDYGGSLELFVVSEKDNKRVYTFNPNFSQRYFFKKGIGSAGAHSQPFTFEKTDKNFRVFCLGASTTVGTPYPARAAFPAMLQNILQTKYPQRQIEVINCGVTAITSFSVLDMAREIIDNYEPDLLVVYSGHNEFYGVFGQGSRLALYDNREMIFFFLQLQKLRLFRLGRDLYASLFAEKIDPNELIDKGTLMGRIASDVDLPFGDPIREKTEINYRENLHDLAELANEDKVPLIICTLVSNLRDQRPFKSRFQIPDSGVGRVKAEQLIAMTKAVSSLRNLNEEKELLQDILAIDSMVADVHYKLGAIYDLQGNYERAFRHYQKAHDFDLIRFIAPTSFNSILRQVAGENNLILADAETSFKLVSDGGIIGNNLILEHIHPNSRGYFLIAKTIAKTIDKNGLIGKGGSGDPPLPDSTYLAMNDLTPLSEEIVHMAVHRLKSHWPFIRPGEQPPPYQRIGNARTEQLADAYVNLRTMSLFEIHVRLANEKLKNKDTDGALAEYRAALAVQADHQQVLDQVIRIYLDKQEFQPARRYLEQALNYHPQNEKFISRMGVVCFLLRDFKTAAVWLEKAVANNPQDKNLQDLLRQTKMIKN